MMAVVLGDDEGVLYCAVGPDLGFEAVVGKGLAIDGLDQRNRSVMCCLSQAHEIVLVP